MTFQQQFSSSQIQTKKNKKKKYQASGINDSKGKGIILPVSGIVNVDDDDRIYDVSFNKYLCRVLFNLLCQL